MKSSLQELEQPIDEAIANGLIEATPEWWNAAILEIESCPQSNGVEGFRHRITSPEGQRDIVQATESIHEHTFRLADLFRQHGRPWRKVVYTVTKQAGGSWKYSADFSY